MLKEHNEYKNMGRREGREEGRKTERQKNIKISWDPYSSVLRSFDIPMNSNSRVVVNC